MQPNLVNTIDGTYCMTTGAFGYCVLPIIIAWKKVQLGTS